MFLKMTNSLKILVLAAVATVGASVSVTFAAEETAKPAHWIKKCITNADSIRTCLLTEAIILENKEKNLRVQLASIRIQSVSNSKRQTMFIQVQNRILLEPGLRFQVDKGTTRVTPFSICFDQVCEAQVSLNDEFVATLKKGNFISLNFLQYDGKPIRFQVPLAGFTAGYNSKGVELTQQQKDILNGVVKTEKPAETEPKSDAKPLPDNN